MSRYDIKNAAERVEGYYMPRPGEADEKAFERAKEETVSNMKAALNQTEALTFEQLKIARRKSQENAEVSHGDDSAAPTSPKS